MIPCYILSLPDRKDRETLQKDLIKIILEIRHMPEIKGGFNNYFLGWEFLFQVIQKDIKAMCQDEDFINTTAFNKPLRNNLVTVIACVSTNIPCEIYGKPGTSKTLSSNIAKKYLGQGKGDQSTVILNSLPGMITQYYCGSQSSKAEEIESLFSRANEKAASLIEEARQKEGVHNIKDLHLKDMSTILFDEFGLLSFSPFHPNKAMHSKLDNIESEKNKVSFIAISNYTTDASLANRMISVYQPDLDQDDLQQTIRAIFLTLKDGDKLRFCNSITGSLAKAYISFRKKQEAEWYHPNFHGTRDFYQMIKYIRVELDKIKPREDGPVGAEAMMRRDILEVVNWAIKKNFSGCMYRDKGGKELITSHTYFTQCFIEDLEKG